MKYSTGISQLDWFLSNVLYWALAAAALLIPSKFALTIWTVITILFVIIWAFVVVVKWMCVQLNYTPENAEELTLAYSLPKWLIHGSDIALSLFMLYFGHWVLALLMFTQAALEYKAREIKLVL